ncbi:hypothetical protein AQUCO_00500533v1 [Aquilegia coerulea]|uniref:TF-B3 domain-containing protein n=1 Tax=Aquilegia coerulea TaxID=218851 RepID=A0A2G5ESC4_AQUCA|nr:hypothetical protein AQUCO_00500533v1 [Aquilegia coerulea]
MKQNQTHGCDSQHQSPPQDHTSSISDEEHWPLSDDKPYFHVVFLKSQVSGIYQLVLPTKMSSILPQAVVPVVLTRLDKNWKMNYIGEGLSHKRFDSGWKNFVIDNNLKVGDGCVFELSECSKDCLKFRVQILEGDFPSELLDRVDGKCSDTPILID